MNYEQFLSDFFARRGISNSFENLPKPLRISSYDLDSGERVIFGSEGFRDVPVSVACAATLATPFFFSPVEIGTRQYIDGGLGDIAHFDVAEESGAKFVIVVNPLVPVSTSFRTVPTGHGAKHSIRDKGLIWVMNQALRISAHNRLHSAIEHVTKRSSMQVLVLEPEPTDMLLFLQNPANPKTRRAILEYAYRTTKDRIAAWLDRNREATNQMGWHTMNSREG